MPEELPELDDLSERAKVVSLLFAATLLTVGVFLRVGSSLANNVLAPGSKIQLCKIAPEPAMKVEHMSRRMMSLLVM
ncbi:hypothetical protein E0H76_15990 [Rhizobium leguminosarum bv. viciae]|nr:hypothetical protein E0H74_13425 [Rhizobium leguminosarum bv. viciae]TCA95551.1 hypothetical protein E0H76_15990 [Rhizobium leguminosarum bv. viciae]